MNKKMDSGTQSKAYRTILVYAAITMLGILLSSIVFINAKKVETSTVNLVDNLIPTLAAIKNLTSSISEQERILYEYYASDDSQKFEQDFTKINAEIGQSTEELSHQFKQSESLSNLLFQQEKVQKISVDFDENMRSDSTDWDMARDQLAEITLSRLTVKPYLKDLETQVSVKTNAGYELVSEQLSNTNVLVIFYSAAILAIAVLIGRYIQGYLIITAKNQRLALFAERNPNPIISLDKSGHVSYFNPATSELLNSINLSEKQVGQLCPSDLSALIKTMAAQDLTSISFEQKYQHQIYNGQLHWLKDLNYYDLHLTDITSRKEAEQKLSYQAFHVQETGLLNKFKLGIDLDNRITSPETNTFSLGLIEVRQFNQLIATHGLDTIENIIHVMADKLSVLIEKNCVGSPCQLYQMSDSVFALLIDNNINDESINYIYRAIEDEISLPINTNYGEFSLELDFGFCYFPVHGDTSSLLLQHARMALDEAISIEHSSLMIYNDSLYQQVNRVSYITSALKSAIANNELELHFQPQMDIQSGLVIGVESLIRWTNEGKFISPAEFIPIAEQSGLIIEIGEWILQQACLQAKLLLEQGHHQVVVAVNISPRQFGHPNFVTLVKQTLANYNLSPMHIELEITEGVIMHNEKDTIAVLHELKSLGVQLSIDDFGTGYSSLSYLKQFPIDKLKVDQSFIKELHLNDQDKTIIRTIVDLGKNLGIKLIAEGVEELEHYNYLKEIGCDEIQGYWYSRPLPTNALTDFLADGSSAKGTNALTS